MKAGVLHSFLRDSMKRRSLKLRPQSPVALGFQFFLDGLHVSLIRPLNFSEIRPNGGNQYLSLQHGPSLLSPSDSFCIDDLLRVLAAVSPETTVGIGILEVRGLSQSMAGTVNFDLSVALISRRDGEAAKPTLMLCVSEGSPSSEFLKALAEHRTTEASPRDEGGFYGA